MKTRKVIVAGLAATAMLLSTISPVSARECPAYDYMYDCEDNDGDGRCDDCGETMAVAATPSYTTTFEETNELQAEVESTFTVTTNSDATPDFWVYDENSLSCTIEGSNGQYFYKVVPHTTGSFYFRVQFAATENYQAINEMYTFNVSESQVMREANLTITGTGQGTVGTQYEATISTDSTATPYIRGDQIYDGINASNSYTNGGSVISAVIEGNTLKVNCTRAGRYSIPIYVDSTDGYLEDHTNYMVEFQPAVTEELKVDGKSASDRKNVFVGESVTYQLSGDTSNLTFDWANRYSNGNIEYSYDEQSKVLTITALHFYSSNTGVKVTDNNANTTVYCWSRTKKANGVVHITDDAGEEVTSVTTSIGSAVTLNRSIDFQSTFKTPVVSDESVVSVAVDTNDRIIITPLAVGTATVTFGVNGTTDYNEVPATVTIEVEEGAAKQDPTITLSKTASDEGADMTDQTFTFTSDSDAEVQVSSSNRYIEATISNNVVTVHATREGTATITVYVEETDNYNAASAVYQATFTQETTEAGALPTGYFYNRDVGRIYYHESGWNGDTILVSEPDLTEQFKLDDITIDVIEGSTNKEAAYLVLGRVAHAGDNCNYTEGKYVALMYTYYKNEWRVNVITSALERDSKAAVKAEVYAALNNCKNDATIRQPIGSTVGYPSYPFYTYNETLHEEGQRANSPLAQYAKWVITKTSTFASEVKPVAMSDEYFFPVCEVSDDLVLSTRTLTFVDENGGQLFDLEIPVRADGGIDPETGYTTVCSSIIEAPAGKSFGGIYQNGELCYTYTMGGKYYTTLMLESDTQVTVKFVDETYIIEDEVKTFDNDKVKVEV